MQLRRDEDDPVEQLLHDRVLVVLVLLSNLGLQHLGLLIDGCLRSLRVARVLRAGCEYEYEWAHSSRVGSTRTEASNALNSSSLYFR